VYVIVHLTPAKHTNSSKIVLEGGNEFELWLISEGLKIILWCYGLNSQKCCAII
jgi:hypothetical protein